MRTVFAFTGIPGTGVQTAIRRIADKLGTSTRTICLDEYLWEEFCAAARSHRPLLDCTELFPEEIKPGAKSKWWQLLVLPPRRIRQFWQKAAERALTELRSTESSEIVLICFHAAYYSDFYRWRFSAVDSNLLQQFKFSAYFCLIDDIYDIQARRKDDLQAERSLIDTSAPVQRRLERLVQLTVSHLEQFIGWRQEEIVLTDHFAATCGVPSHVVAVKHPVNTIINLIRKPSHSYYVSHPITGVRAQGNDFAQSSQYRSIVEFVRRVRATYTVIEPTTIDEFRFGHAEVNGERCVVPVLTPRWPAPGDYPLVDPADVPGSNGMESVCAAENVTFLGLSDCLCDLVRGEGVERLTPGVFNAMRQLEARVSEDITWRDHHLVDQTGQLIVYRPVADGVPSTGVRREVQYFAKLVQTGALKGVCVVFHPTQDRHSDHRRVAYRVIENLSKNETLRDVFRPPLSEVADSLASGISTVLATSAQSEEAVSGVSVVVLQYTNVEPRTIDARPMSSGHVSTFRETQKQPLRVMSDIISDTLTYELYLDEVMSRSSKDVVILVEQEDEMYAVLRSIEGQRSPSSKEESTDANR